MERAITIWQVVDQFRVKRTWLSSLEEGGRPTEHLQSKYSGVLTTNASHKSRVQVLSHILQNRCPNLIVRSSWQWCASLPYTLMHFVVVMIINFLLDCLDRYPITKSKSRSDDKFQSRFHTIAILCIWLDTREQGQSLSWSRMRWRLRKIIFSASTISSSSISINPGKDCVRSCSKSQAASSSYSQVMRTSDMPPPKIPHTSTFPSHKSTNTTA